MIGNFKTMIDKFETYHGCTFHVPKLCSVSCHAACHNGLRESACMEI